MALKDSWVDKKDGDYILAEDINAVAHGVIDIEETLPQTIDEKLGEAKESGEFDGKDGLSAYELALKNGTTTAKSEAEWLASLKGKDGDDGLDGERGLAYYRLKSNLVGSLENYPFSDFLIPDDYVPKPYDLVLYNDGNLGYIYSVTEDEKRAAVAHIPNATLKGPDGFSPTVSVSKRNGVATVTITDKEGTKTVDILDGSANGGIDPDIFLGNDVIIPETSLTMTEWGSGSETAIHSDASIETGKTYTVIWNGVKYSCVGKDPGAAYNSVILGNGIFFGLPATDEPFCLRFHNNAELMENVEINSLEYIETATVEVTTPPMIDPRYIPDMYYTEERQDAEILPTSTAIDTGNAIMGELYVVGDPITLVEGKTYKVTYNGVEYECVASYITAPGIGDGIALGDVGIITTGTPSGDYPFLFGTNASFGLTSYSGIIIPLDGASSITVSIVGYAANIHKIPEEYLPEYIGVPEFSGDYIPVYTTSRNPANDNDNGKALQNFLVANKAKQSFIIPCTIHDCSYSEKDNFHLQMDSRIVFNKFLCNGNDIRHMGYVDNSNSEAIDVFMVIVHSGGTIQHTKISG